MAGIEDLNEEHELSDYSETVEEGKKIQNF